LSLGKRPLGHQKDCLPESSKIEQFSYL
jgi:hypothetical protein